MNRKQHSLLQGTYGPQHFTSLMLKADYLFIRKICDTLLTSKLWIWNVIDEFLHLFFKVAIIFVTRIGYFVINTKIDSISYV